MKEEAWCRVDVRLCSPAHFRRITGSGIVLWSCVCVKEKGGEVVHIVGVDVTDKNVITMAMSKGNGED